MGRVNYIAPRMGFRTYGRRNTFLAAALNGIGALGDDSSTLTAVGFSPTQIADIVARYNDGRLSAPGYQFLLGGGLPSSATGVDQAILDDFFYQDPGAPTDSSPTPGNPAPVTAQTPGVPNGAQVTYQGIFVTSNMNRDPLQTVIQQLAAQGLPVISATILDQPSILSQVILTDSPITVQIVMRVAGPGFSQVSDVASIVNGLAYRATGNMPQTGAAAVTGLPGQTSGLPFSGLNPDPQKLTAWLEKNALWLLLGVGAFVVISKKL